MELAHLIFVHRKKKIAQFWVNNETGRQWKQVFHFKDIENLKALQQGHVSYLFDKENQTIICVWPLKITPKRFREIWAKTEQDWSF
jgi:uncharacterized protein with NAD-binding domain and iron-sulfur cluster